MEKQDREKILSINILRFFAAVAVMFYHYIFMFTQRGYTEFDYRVLWNISHYGYLGVDLFFIISGFVIAMSAENRDLFHFALSRIGRLYPIYWTSVTITSIFVFFYGYTIETTTNIKSFLANMTMQPSMFGFSPIDGSYWSLTVELMFYILIGLLIIVNKYKYLEKITIILSVALGLGAINHIVPFNWSSYFLAGILFYFIYKNGSSIVKIISLIFNLIASIIYATSRAPSLSDGYHANFDQITITTYIVSFYFIFLLISLKYVDNFIGEKVNQKTKKFIIILGSLTFPVYLLHQTIGHIILKALERFELGAILSLLVTTVFIFSISYTLNICIEKRGRELIIKCANYLANLFKILYFPRTSNR